MAYLGQGAQLITNGDAVIQNVFYATIPGGAGSAMYWYASANLYNNVLNPSQVCICPCHSSNSEPELHA
jgi:K+ transporter